MRITDVVKDFEFFKPKDEVEAMVECGVSLRHIGEGAFRNVYEVEGLPLVLKVPIWHRTRLPRAREHAKREIKVHRRCVRWPKKYALVLPYLPRIYYADLKTGVLLMHKYKVLSFTDSHEKRCRRIGNTIGSVLNLPIDGWDAWPQNFGKDEDGKLALLDLGCLLPTRDFGGNKKKK